MKIDRSERAKASFDELAELVPLEVVPGAMFGKPCLKVDGGKAFACQFRDATAFKLPEPDRSQALGLTAAELFDPSGKGRTMKQWVQVPVDHADRWPELAEKAARYVAG
jgi:hypothetical protein